MRKTYAGLFYQKEQINMEKENIMAVNIKVMEKSRMKRFINSVKRKLIPVVSGVLTMTMI